MNKELARELVKDIPNIREYPITYVFEKMGLKHKPGTLWLEFGVAAGISIKKIASYTEDVVYGFDSFEGLPEYWRPQFGKGKFSQKGRLPKVPENVKLIKGWFNEVLDGFLEEHPEKVSFLHIDSDIYSSAKYVLDRLKDRLEDDCVIVFDELLNYPGFDGDNGELRAWHEFITENEVEYEWIGMNGRPYGMTGTHRLHNAQHVALRLKSIKPGRSG